MPLYPNDSTVANTKGSTDPHIVWQRDSLRLECMALENAEDMAARTLKAGAKDMSEEEVAKLRRALQVIVGFYSRIYHREPNKPVASACDFRALIDFVKEDPLNGIAWAAFSTCFAMAVPMQHAVNGLLAGQNLGIDRKLAQSVSYVGLMASASNSEDGRKAIVLLAGDVQLFGDQNAAAFMTAGPSQIVEDADAFARDWVSQNRKKKEEPKAE